MSKCVSCKYALYDGMCMAQGKYTVLDADSCELYRPTQGHEVARLKRENTKLREMVRKMYTTISWCDENTYPTAAKKAEYADAMRELGIEVEE